MTSHELAKLLLSLPDLPVATHAVNHDWFSGEGRGSIAVVRTRHYSGEHIQIGDLSKRMTNPPNWFVLESYTKPLPNHWNVKLPNGCWNFAKYAQPYPGVTDPSRD